MLNELIEFRQYTFDISTYNSAERDAVKPRLNHRNICNNLSGIERAMTIIARYYYYNYYSESKQEPPVVQERIVFVKDILKTWCGASEQCPGELSHLQAWLPRYIKDILIAEKLKLFEVPNKALFSSALQVELELWVRELKTACEFEKRWKAIEKLRNLTEQYPDYNTAIVSIFRLESALVDLRGKKTEFSKKMFVPYISDDEASKWTNDYKKITYDSIIANAINGGPLSNLVLVCDSDLFALIHKKKGRLLDADKDRIPKMLVAFLLNRTNSNQESAVINKSDIANWCEGNPKMDKADYEKYLFADEQLFRIHLVGNNVAKLTIPKVYLEIVKPKICLKSDLPFLDTKTCSIYEDYGAGRKLESISII